LVWNIAALVLALIGAAGSLWLSLGMAFIPCPLCYYQRAFVLGAAGVLLMALLTESRGSASISLLALPLAAAGMGVAAFHVYLESNGILECPSGWLELGTAPQQSLAVFVVLVLFLAVAGIRRPAMIVAVVVGGVLAAASITSAPKLPDPPTKAYPEGPILSCRPPFRG
jgi:disulfide bond formation protein DsbB